MKVHPQGKTSGLRIPKFMVGVKPPSPPDRNVTRSVSNQGSLALGSLSLSTEKVWVQRGVTVLLLQLLIIQQKVATYISQKAVLTSACAELQHPLAEAEKRLPA